MKRNHKLKFLLVALLLAFTFLIFTACSPSTPDVDNQETSTETTETPDAANLGLGDSVTLDDVTITLLSMSESGGSEYNKPEDGNVFLLLEFLFENNSSEEVTIGTMGNFDAYVDTYAVSTSYEGIVEAGADKALDKAVAPGKKLQGFIAYEVPTSWQVLEVNVTPDFFSSATAEFIISK